MNRFLTRKTKRDGTADGPGPSPTTSESPGLPQPAAKKGWRRRKPVAEKKPDISPDLFLPSTDSFRTSLIMPNLSTRFSMLRDQDDPFSMMGKASDDSVLEPKRKSRLMDYGYQPGGLTDIAEISSLKAPVRPFAVTRQASFTYGEGYNTDDETQHTGSIMSRSRPGEGNVLFGGRQKIYKIPIGDSGSVKSLGTGEPRGMRGRALYEDDVSMSAFQRFREKEKQKQLENGRSSDDSERDADAYSIAKENLNSPSLSSYNENRETISSTNSGPSILSSTTAATSVASHSFVSASGSTFPSPSLDQGPPKSRRLYEQGLDQHVHEQQSIALTRLNSLQRKSPSPGGNTLTQSKSASNLNEPRSRSPSASSRTASPLPPISTEQLTTFGSTKPRRPSTATKNSANSGSPKGTPHDDKDDNDMLQSSLDSVAQGKSSALTNSRPRGLDGQQYQNRQPPPFQQQGLRQKRPTAHMTTSPVKSFGRPSVEDSRNGPMAMRTDRSWSASSASRDTRTPSFEDRGSAQQYDGLLSPESRDSNSAESSRGASFASNDDAGDNGARGPNGASLQNGQYRSRGISSPDDQVDALHPALRQTSQIEDSKLSFLHDDHTPQQKDSGVDFDGDSPTLGPVADSRLSGMVREHLRQRSNGSSIYPMNRGGGDDRASGFDFRIPSIYGLQNQWGLDDYRTAYSETVSDPPNNRNIPSAGATQPNGHFNDEEAKDLQSEKLADWELEMRKHHLRAGSAETQAEREAFANELAQRQRAIQENLRIKVENDAVASTPPLPSPAHSSSSGLRPFALLRSKSSHESIGAKQDSSSKTSSKTSTKSSNKLSIKPSKSDPNKSKNPPSPLPVGRTLHSRMPGAMDEYAKHALEQRRMRPEPDQERYPLEIYSTPPESATGFTGSHSSDDGPGPTGRYRDDLEKAMVEGTSSRGNAFYDQRAARLTAAKAARQTNIENGRLKRQAKNPPPPRISTDEATRSMRSRKNSSPASASSDGSSHPPTSADTPYSANSTPPLFNTSSPTSHYHAHAQAQANGVPSGEKAPYSLPSHTGWTPATSNRKKWLHKAEISEPTLISQTSTIDTVSLPPGNALRKPSHENSRGSAAPPPSLPPMHPLRRGFLGAFSRSSSEHSFPNGISGKNKGIVDEYGDEELMPGQRLRIRKVSGDGGDSRRKGRLMVVPVDSADDPSTSSRF